MVGAYQATDDAPTDSPQCRIASYDYRYMIRVTAEGYGPADAQNVDPDQSWSELAVTLAAQ